MHSLRLSPALLLALLLTPLLGCPELEDAAPKRCSKAYEQCTLSSGVLGVCDTVSCPEGASGPCLVCRSQH